MHRFRHPLWAIAFVVLGSPGCTEKTPPPETVLIASFEEPKGVGIPWSGGLPKKIFPTHGAMSYEVRFKGENGGFHCRPDALPRVESSYRKLLMDIQNPSAPFSVRAILAGSTREKAAIFEEVWIGHGASVLEFDLSHARSSGLDSRELSWLQVGPGTPGDREYLVYVDNLRFTRTGPAGPPRTSKSGEVIPAESLIPNGGFEEGLSGWTPWTFGAARAAFALVHTPEAFRGGASCGVFHRVEGKAGIASASLALPPGRYSLCAAVRATGAGKVAAERAEEPRPGESGPEFLTFPVGTVEAGDEWKEASIDLDLPPGDPIPGLPGGWRRFRLRFFAESGDFFLDEVLLNPLDPDGGGPKEAPPRGEPAHPDTLAFLGLGTKLLPDLGAGEEALCADLGPALLGGGTPEGAIAFAERGSRLAGSGGGKAGVRLWMVSTVESTVLVEEVPSLGIAPSEVRAARASLAAAGRIPLAVVARPHRSGELEAFADTCDLLAGGSPLRLVRRIGGLGRFAEGLDLLRRVSDSSRGSEPARRSAALAWIDLRIEKGGEPAKPEELRAMVYLALIHESDGILFRSFDGEKNASVLRVELERLKGEIAGAGKELLEISGLGRIEATDRRIHARAGRTGKGFLLILCNPEPAAVEGFQLRAPPGIPGEPRSRSLGPYECRIERIEVP